jgi:methylated-DNA-[protein]-cysteine S-methyltransferase
MSLDRVPCTVTRIPSPVGELVLAASESGIRAVYFPTSRHGLPPASPRWEKEGEGEGDDGHGPAGELLDRARHQLAEYFARTRTVFDVPLDPVGTVFQRRVWDALRAIPYGTTLSYSELARRLGDPLASRAVGTANGRNPIPIIVPCHRVIGAHGELTGFGGGLDRKRWLLEHEGALLPLEG